MRRAIVLALLVALAGLESASPAAAKGAEEVRISAPGLAPITVGYLDADPQRPTLNTVGQQLRFYDAVIGPASGSPLAREDRAPAGELGPHVRVSWTMSGGAVAPGDGRPIHQDVYLFTEDGPWVRTHPGQFVYDEPITPGWHRADARLVATMAELGVPDAAALRAAATRVRPLLRH